MLFFLASCAHEPDFQRASLLPDFDEIGAQWVADPVLGTVAMATPTTIHELALDGAPTAVVPFDDVLVVSLRDAGQLLTHRASSVSTRPRPTSTTAASRRSRTPSKAPTGP